MENSRCLLVGGKKKKKKKRNIPITSKLMLQSLSINISRRLLCCLRATNKLWMLIRKGQYSANQNKLRGGRHKRGANKNEKGKQKKKKSADTGRARVKVTGEPVAGPVKPEMILFLGHQSSTRVPRRGRRTAASKSSVLRKKLVAHAGRRRRERKGGKKTSSVFQAFLPWATSSK